MSGVRTSVAGIALAGFAVLLSGPAWAATLQFDAVTSASATAGALHTDLTNEGHDLIVDGSRDHAVANANTAVGAGDATASASAGGSSRFGWLAGSAIAQSDLGTLGDQAGASGTVNALFSDMLTIQSATLAPGTPVTLRFGAYGHFLNNLANAPGSSGIFDMHLDTDQGSIVFHHDTLPLAGEFRQTGTMEYLTSVGADVGLTGSMMLEADAFSDHTLSGNGTNYANLDATSTGRFSVAVLTPGATYSAQSGTQYVSAVPVPASLPLLLSALAGLALARRKRTA